MANVPSLAKPGTLRPWWMTAIVTGQTTNARLPLSHLGALPKGAILVSLADYVADAAATADADPGAGKVRWNNAAQASATQIYIDDADSAATDYSALWATLSAGGYLYLYKPDDLDVWQQWSITTVTDAAGYLKLGVSLVASNGSFTDADAVVLTIQQPNPAAGVDRNILNAIPVTSGNAAVDCALGDYFTLAPTANVTGWTFTNVPPACTIMIRFTQDTTARTVAWPASFKWAGGSAGAVSTASGAKDVIALTTFDGGTTWQATIAKAFA